MGTGGSFQPGFRLCPSAGGSAGKEGPWWPPWGHRGGTSCCGDSEGTARSSPGDDCLCPGGRRWGGKNHERWDENQRGEEQGPWAKSAAAANVINSRAGGSHPFQTRPRTLDALPEAELQTHPERSRHRQREILFSCFKNKKSDKISRERCRLGPAPAPGGCSLGTDVHCVWQGRCPGNEGMLPARELL